MGTKKKKSKSSSPRHKRLNRVDRLQVARLWIPKFEGKNILQGYKKHFGLDLECALVGLEMLPIPLDKEYVKQVRKSEGNRIQDRKNQKEMQNQPQTFDMDSDDNFYLIMGNTSNGFPYGIAWGEKDEEGFCHEKASSIIGH